MNQEESEHNEVDGMKKGVDSTCILSASPCAYDRLVTYVLC